MNTDKLLELAFYTLPALITGGVAYYLLNSFFKDQQNSRKWQINKENQKLSLPLKLQAYERLTLYLERINLVKLIVRIAPENDSKTNYENLLIQNIEQEFEHNLAQQLYISNETWTIIVTAKNTTNQIIRKTAMSEKITTSQKLREAILNDLMENESPSSLALSYLKNEVRDIL